MRLLALLCPLSLASSVLSQQIWDVVSLSSYENKERKNFTENQWQTTWDRQKLFTRQPTTSGLPINFGNPGAIGQADIVIEDTQVFQTMDGFGATLST
jgi:hypothetical protein